jgi:histidinol phosphatase-like enzyme (inositol monophosphatase family)
MPRRKQQNIIMDFTAQAGDGLSVADFELIRRTLIEAADVAALETLPRFRTKLAVENKWAVGFDPVTEADKQAETAIRDLITARFPSHGLIGEEWDPKLSDSAFEWIIDPVDGTRAFISGVPVWGTLIGFMAEGRALAGLMAQPFTGETYIGLPGEARYLRGEVDQVIHASGVTELPKAKLSTTSPEIFDKPHTRAVWDTIRPMALQTRYGLDCYAYCLLAAGHIDLVIEAGLKNVDIAPLIPIIRNAGGVISTWDGGPAEAGGNCVAAATQELLDAALEVINGV